jgi:pyruvate/2-oxoglutarate dehydrogenase complex dihydrolipoamide dehydrogenase (E3) component
MPPTTTPQKEQYDLLVLGSGEAGKYIAWTMASAGKKAAVIERRYIGGSCPNIACLPSKNFIYSAKMAHLTKQAADFGLPASPDSVNMNAVRERKRAMVSGLIAMHKDRYDKTHTELILGEGRFVAPKTVEVTFTNGGTRLLTGTHVVISTGSRATIPSIPGLLESKPLTHIQALELDHVPTQLLILGGGYVGLEFAQAFRRFGSSVTVIEHNARLLQDEDDDIAQAVTGVLTGEGIELLNNVDVREVLGTSGQLVTLQLNRESDSRRLQGKHLLVATGRTPNTDDIGLDTAGVKLTPKGHVQVNERLETTAEGVFAVGDCAGSPHFTHIAFDDFRVIRDNLLGRPRVTTGRLVPSCLFLDPELARVGLNETAAKRNGTPYRLLKLPMQAVLRTRITGETTGFIKALIGATDDAILGFSAFGQSAGELMATVQLAMSAKLPYTAVRDSIFTHPTYSEGLVYLFSFIPTQIGASAHATV